VKIRAIRLQEVGRFRDAIALEGLTGGLDVLAGPNELGKSTILKAVKLALFEKHTSAKKDIESLRPYAGGAPLIEIDLEVDGRQWRLRKQYLSGRSAELREIASGAVARGADAETRLSELLSGAAETRPLELLWVDQGSSLSAVAPAGTARSALLAAIEGEVETVADGSVARVVQARVTQELAALVTGHATPRPAGRLKNALDLLKELEHQDSEARARLTAAEARLRELEEVRREIAALADPAAAAARKSAAETTAKACEEAKQAREKYRQAQAAVATQEERFKVLAAALHSFDARINDLAKQEEACAQEVPKLTGLERSVAEAEARASEGHKRRAELKAALAAAEQARKSLEVATRLAEVRDRLEKARAAASEHRTLTEAIASNRADDTALRALRREAGSIATLQAGLSAAAPSVTIAYARGGAGKIKIGGRFLEDGETLSPTRAVALEIEGVGTVTIAPGQSERLADREAELAAQEEALAGLLRDVGAATVADAEQRAVDRRALQQQLVEAAAALKALAPDGIAGLEQIEAQLEEQTHARPTPEQRTAADIEAQARELLEAMAEADTQLHEATSAHAEAREALVQMRARAEQRHERIASERAALGDPETCSLQRQQKADALASADQDRNAAVRESAAWREAAPDADRFAALEATARTAEASRAVAERKLAELRRLEAGIEGQLKADRADDVEARVAELDDARAHAASRVAALQEELAALQLLARELDAAQTATRDHFAKPVMARLAPYLELVFPDARPHFGAGLQLDKLQRAAGVEDIAQLSEGTQEQLAVLVRLGFGRLLAERGAPVPLILDDALVYADDRRIEQMFDALKLAAESHQVLVLTCRERSFESLGGNRVAICEWRM
jgi:energy-coupling factor transporter ATP-binding protein EcfA2